MTAKQAPIVIVDTNAIWGTYFLDSKPWTQLRRLAEERLIRLVVPHVVVMEATRQWSDQAKDALEDLRDARQNVKKHFRGLDPLADWSPRRNDPDPEVEAGEYEERLTTILAEANAEIAPIPEISHEDLLNRDFAGRKPFAPTGKGYRDTRIWESIVPIVKDSDGDTYLLSKDIDFSDKKGVLYPDLVEDLGNAADRFHPVKDLKDLLSQHLAEAVSEYDEMQLAAAEAAVAEAESHADDWPPDQELSLDELVHDSVLAAAEQLVGYELDTDPSMGSAADGLRFSGLELPPGPDSYDVGSVSYDESSVDFQVYDHLEGDTVLGQASIDVEVEFHAYIYKGNYYVLDNDDEFSIVEFDWNDHLILASVTREARLYFQVRADSGAIDYVDFEYAEPIGGVD